jgi:hypothetical protein
MRAAALSLGAAFRGGDVSGGARRIGLLVGGAILRDPFSNQRQNTTNVQQTSATAPPAKTSQRRASRGKLRTGVKAEPRYNEQ